ncbi:MAG: hypothetical protein F6K47_24975 [Symploca sp. SIO2E6]|nr:hypothetical protein [Symploca sp. SIO2E6]
MEEIRGTFGRVYFITAQSAVNYVKGTFHKSPKPFAFSAIEQVLDTNELIFTSMDKKGITAARAHLISNEEFELKQSLIKLAQKIYCDFYLNALVRVDIRADANNNLYVLEANPKPDLKRPTENVTSLVALGLADQGMSYEDLILTLLGDRLDYLLRQHFGIISHIVELLD